MATRLGNVDRRCLEDLWRAVRVVYELDFFILYMDKFP